MALTMGHEELSSHEKILGRVPARPIDAEGATGAGDAFWAGILVALLDGGPPERCALFAREVVELELSRKDPLPAEVDRKALYTRLAAHSS